VDTVHECDGQADRRTDRITITKTVQRIASHGKNRTERSFSVITEYRDYSEITAIICAITIL